MSENEAYVYCDSDMIHIARSQMELVKGELPERENEVAVSEYFLSTYGLGAKIGETARLDTESFQGGYTVTGILSNVGEKEGNTCAIAISKASFKKFCPATAISVWIPSGSTLRMRKCRAA